jgi:hypothetical protein
MRVRNVVVGSVTLLEAQLVEDLNSAISVDGANVGIGTDSPVRTCHIVKDPASRSAGGLLYALNQPLIIEDDNRPGIQLIGSENNIGIIEFADDAHANAGSINFDHSTDRLRFGFGDDAEKVYIDSSGNMVISGDLTVNGTTATVSTTNTVIEDKLLELGNGVTGTPSGDAGIIIERGSSANAALIWDESRDEFVLGTTSATGASTGDLTVTPGNISVERIGAGTEQAETEVHAKRDTASGVQYSTTASVIAEDDTRPSIQLAGGANNIGLIQFGDNAAEASGQIYYDHSTDKLRLDCGGNADRLTVDGSGNMVVAGNVEVGSTGVGTSFTCTGEAVFDYSQQFLIKGLSGAAATIELSADDAEDNADKCQIAVADGGVFSINNYGEGNWGAGLTLDFANNTVKAGHGGDTAYLASNGNYDVVLKTGNSTTGSITITDGADGDITLATNGSGKVAFGPGDATAMIMSNGTQDLQIMTSGTGPTITLTDGTNGGISLEPHGTGDLCIWADTAQFGDQNADATLTTYGTGDMILSTNAGTNSGVIRIYDGANGDITFAPNGSGQAIVNGLFRVSTTDAQTTSGQMAIFEGIDGNTNEVNRIAINANSANADSGISFLDNSSTKWTVGCDGSTDEFHMRVGYGLYGVTDEFVLNSAGKLTLLDDTASSGTTGAAMRLAANDGAAMGDNERLGSIEFAGAEDGSNTITVGARIDAICDAGWAADENGAALVFYTTDGDASQSEALRLDSDQLAAFAGGITSTAAANTLGATSFNDAAITNVGDIDCDSISVDAAATGLNIDMSGANTGTGLITLGDNLAAALTIKEGSAEYMKFTTTNGNEFITTSKEFNVIDDVKLTCGNTGDLGIWHDGTDNHIESGTALNIMTVNSGVAVSIGHTTSETTVNDNLTVTGDATANGNLQVNSATATAAGAGFGNAASQNMYVSNINGEIVTTILVDIDGLQNGGAAGDIVGDEGEANAYLTRLTPALNGYPYRVEMNCVEPPSVTGDASGGNKYSLAFNTAALAEDAAYTGGSNAVLVIDGTSNAWSDGMSVTNAGDVDLSMGGNYDSGGGAYVYIACGATVTGGNLEVTSGKFVIKFYAANF